MRQGAPPQGVSGSEPSPTRLNREGSSLGRREEGKVSHVCWQEFRCTRDPRWPPGQGVAKNVHVVTAVGGRTPGRTCVASALASWSASSANASAINFSSTPTRASIALSDCDRQEINAVVWYWSAWSAVRTVRNRSPTRPAHTPSPLSATASATYFARSACPTAVTSSTAPQPSMQVPSRPMLFHILKTHSRLGASRVLPSSASIPVLSLN